MQRTLTSVSLLIVLGALIFYAYYVREMSIKDVSEWAAIGALGLSYVIPYICGWTIFGTGHQIKPNGSSSGRAMYLLFGILLYLFASWRLLEI